MSHCGSREHLSQEKDDQPSGAFPDQSAEGNSRIWLVEGLRTADLLDFACSFRFSQPKDIVQGDDTQQHSVVVAHRQSIPAMVAEDIDGIFLRIVYIEGQELAV